MKHPILIPSLGLVEAITLTIWAKATGDRIAKGETVATIETEKSQVEIESPTEGTLEIAIPAGPELVSAEATLGYIDDNAG